MADEQKQDPIKKLVIEFLASFLTDPKNITPELIERVDTQANLHSTEFAAMLNYHRTVADEFEIFNPDGKQAKDRINKATRYANRLSLESEAFLAMARWQAFGGLVGSPGQKAPMTLENLAGMIVKAPEGMEQPEKKDKRFGII